MGLRSLWASLKRLFKAGFVTGEAPPPEPQTTTYASGTGLVEITTPAVPGRPPSGAEAAKHHQFIASNWKKLAAAAYAGFRRHGIGVVVIERRAGSNAAVAGAFSAHDLAYATGMGMWTQRPPHSAAPDWLDEQFQTYEPLEAGLFLFRSAGAAGSPAAGEGRAGPPPRPYHAAGTPAPPQALRETRARFN